ncbi:hemicentin-2 isoform X2 [Nematostella vectensis]|uniref:hemicentin-2 isoform X2 n=1 Tax=Nematostella vectensis TaxID=45351 RepID=UPI0013903A2B|nr:hemicentin-2 isoform X2 [Nematostella vectensis]
MVLLLVALVVQVVQGQALVCKLSTRSHTQGVWPGNNITLNCSVILNGPAEKFIWRKNGHLLSNSTIVYPSYTPQLGYWEDLVISNVQLKDEGSYSCTAIQGNSQDEDWYTVNVYVKPRITHPRQFYVELSRGDRAVVRCKADGWPPPYLRWYKEGMPLSPHSKIEEVSLHITFARQSDQGMYYCRANNTVGSEIRPILIKMKQGFRQRVSMHIAQLSSETVYVGGTIKLACTCTGILLKYTKVIWKKDGAEVTNRSRALIDKNSLNPGQITYTVTVNNVTRKDSGNYTCELQTERSHDVATARIEVRQKVTPRVKAKDHYVATRLGSTVSISCTASNVNLEFDTTKWTRNGTEASVQQSQRFHTRDLYSYEGSMESTLIIKGVRIQDFGCYKCTVATSNGLGSSWVCLLQDLESEIADTRHSRSQDKWFWHTAILITLVCVVACTVAFIVFLFHKSRRKRSSGFLGGPDLHLKDSFTYDVFITFSNKDLDWVKTELIPLVERHNLNYCIHSRDFEPGRTIVDNMADSVYRSRTVLAVLSENYMSSEFCRCELSMALCRDEVMKDSSVIGIRVDGIEIKKLPRAIRDKTLLDYHETKERAHWQARLAKQLTSVTGKTKTNPQHIRYFVE